MLVDPVYSQIIFGNKFTRFDLTFPMDNSSSKVVECFKYFDYLENNEKKLLISYKGKFVNLEKRNEGSYYKYLGEGGSKYIIYSGFFQEDRTIKSGIVTVPEIYSAGFEYDKKSDEFYYKSIFIFEKYFIDFCGYSETKGMKTDVRFDECNLPYIPLENLMVKAIKCSLILSPEIKFKG